MSTYRIKAVSNPKIHQVIWTVQSITLINMYNRQFTQIKDLKGFINIKDALDYKECLEQIKNKTI